METTTGLSLKVNIFLHSFRKWRGGRYCVKQIVETVKAKGDLNIEPFTGNRGMGRGTSNNEKLVYGEHNRMIEN